jgi:hypothetical protein
VREPGPTPFAYHPRFLLTRGAAMSRLIVSLLLVLALLAAASAGDAKPRDLILGKWESQDGVSKGVVVEFKDNGTTTATFKGRVTSTGKYKFVEDDVLEFEATFLGAGKKLISRFRIKITGDELTQTDLNTKSEKHLKRVQ